MQIFNLENQNYDRNNTIMYTFELIDGDRIALNHIPDEAIDLYYNYRVNKKLSFVIFNVNNLCNYSFAIIRKKDLQHRINGVELIGIGYSSIESFQDLMEQLKLHVFSFIRNGHQLYDYIWASNTIFYDTMAVNHENQIAILERD